MCREILCLGSLCQQAAQPGSGLILPLPVLFPTWVRSSGGQVPVLRPQWPQSSLLWGHSLVSNFLILGESSISSQLRWKRPRGLFFSHLYPPMSVWLLPNFLNHLMNEFCFDRQRKLGHVACKSMKKITMSVLCKSPACSGMVVERKSVKRWLAS